VKGVSKTGELSPGLASVLYFTRVLSDSPVSRRHTMKPKNVAIDLSGSGLICSPETHRIGSMKYELRSMSRQNIDC
jgi:hypothetical protein